MAAVMIDILPETFHKISKSFALLHIPQGSVERLLPKLNLFNDNMQYAGAPRCNDSHMYSPPETPFKALNCEIEECFHHIILYSDNLLYSLATIGIHGNQLSKRSIPSSHNELNITVKVTTVPCPYSFFYYYIYFHSEAHFKGQVFEKLEKAVSCYAYGNSHPHKKIQLWTVKNVK